MHALEYLRNKEGQLKAVVIPIELWQSLFLSDDASAEELTEAMEDYCLGKAMDEVKESALLSLSGGIVTIGSPVSPSLSA